MIKPAERGSGTYVRTNLEFGDLPLGSVGVVTSEGVLFDLHVDFGPYGHHTIDTAYLELVIDPIQKLLETLS